MENFIFCAVSKPCSTSKIEVFAKVVNYPAGIHLLKVNNKNTMTRCEICWKLTIKTPERRQFRRFGVFIVNFKHISHLVLVFLLLTLNIKIPVNYFHEKLNLRCLTGFWIRFCNYPNCFSNFPWVGILKQWQMQKPINAKDLITVIVIIAFTKEYPLGTVF